MISAVLHNAIVEKLRVEGDRPEDGLLHASGDIVGPLRHTMLRMAGAPQKPLSTASILRLRTGTLWHTDINRLIDSHPDFRDVQHEIPVNDGLPDGWGGTADTVAWIGDECWLLDYKTTKGAGLQYIDRDGAKPEHIAQVSAYYHALRNLGFPVSRVGVLYLPMEEDYKAETPVELSFQDIWPLDKDKLFGAMLDRSFAVAEYLRTAPVGDHVPDSAFLTDALAGTMPREQKLFKKKDLWDVTLVPHWSAMFCPFSDELCPCSSEGMTKVGHFKDGTYYPRAGYEFVTPTVAPKGVTV